MATTSPAGTVALLQPSRDFRLPVSVSHLDSLVAKSALAWPVIAGTLRPV